MLYLISHHFKLLVSPNPEEWSSDSDHGTISDVGKSLNDKTSASHLSKPVIIGTLSPVLGLIPVGDGEDTNLMSLPVQLLDRRVVGVLVRGIEGALDLAAVGILPLSTEDGPIEINVVTVDGPVEGDCDHLGNLCGVDVARDSSPVGRAEAVWELALAEVAVGGAVGVLVDGARVLVGPVAAVRLLVAKQLLVDAVAVSALQLTVRTDGLVRLQVGQDAAGL